MILTLNRLRSMSSGTYGCFMIDNFPVCWTYELPWLGNVINKSCIPVGSYDVIKAVSPRFGDCFHLSKVPGRSGILIHPGNDITDTRGCILPGLDITPIGVIHSRKAMDRLLDALPSRFTLNIREA